MGKSFRNSGLSIATLDYRKVTIQRINLDMVEDNMEASWISLDVSLHSQQTDMWKCLNMGVAMRLHDMMGHRMPFDAVLCRFLISLPLSGF